MIMPNTMCRPPNPAAMSQLPHAAGPNSAMAPTSMKQIPITGPTRTENAPPVTNPAPYKSSQVPGSARHKPARDRGKRYRALHRLPDEAEVVERTVVQRPRSDHDSHTMSRRPAVVKYFVIQSKAGR